MPVSLDDLMKELPPDRRAEVEREASALAADYRARLEQVELDSDRQPEILGGAMARTGERCPESGVWRVAGKPSETKPITIHSMMPPYRDRPVMWELIRPATA